MKLTFLGAAGEVTGSCFLVETSAVRFLVDCGMFQGGREAERKNREAFGFDVRSLDFVLLTHAHIDHSGLLPRLAALGFKGPVHTTRATADLLSVMLPDSAYVQEKEAEWDTRHRRREGRERRAEREKSLGALVEGGNGRFTGGSGLVRVAVLVREILRDRIGRIGIESALHHLQAAAPSDSHLTS